MESISIQPLAADDLSAAADLLTQLNPETPAIIITQRLRSLLAEHTHYQLFGAFTSGRLVGVAGAWIATKIWCGRYLEIDNLVVSTEQRSSGIGSLLIRHLEELAHQRDCKIVIMDSYTNNHPSHRLYHRLGFEIWGFHFIKPLGDWKGVESR